MNEGTARLKIFLDTACGSVDSSRRRRTCGAKRNKAIGDYADKLAILAAPDAVFEAKFMLPWSFSEEAAAEIEPAS